MFRQYKIIAALMMLAGVAPMALADTQAEDLMIAQAWAREAPPAAVNGAVYLVIDNKSGKPDLLLGGSTQAADSVELHTHVHEDGLMKMQRLPDVEIPVDTATEFKPGEKHIMLIGLSSALSAGNEFLLQLEFKSAGQKEILVKVHKDGEQPMGHMKHSE